MKRNRREFLKLTGMAGITLGSTAFKPSKVDLFSMNTANGIKFISPLDGDMLNEYDGTVVDGNLITVVKITAPAKSKIRVNGVKAKYIDGIFQADIKLKNYENDIELVEEKTGYKASNKVFWLRNCVNKYRFSFNAQILFLKDICHNAKMYNSIFENPYLSCLKQVHDTYGTKMHLNVFYQTDGFNLSQMTDKFKSEWKANAEWLRLSFSAIGDKPDKPYITASYDQVKKECAIVKEQIRRFAGEEVMGSETTLHWGEATVEGCRALRDSGYSILAGYFNVDDDKPAVSYYLNEEQRRHIKKRFIWRDNAEGIIFARLALVVNTVKIKQISSYLDDVKKTYNPGHIDLMIHEQYFYPDYFSYQPDYKDKVIEAVKWAVDNGFKPGFLQDSLF